jgi:hypothetical protein
MTFDELIDLNHPPELEEDDPVVVSVQGPAPSAKPAPAESTATTPVVPTPVAAVKPEDDASLSSHDRRIVRALRKEEERNQREIARLKAENEALRAKAPAAEAEDGEIDDQTMEDLKEFSPKVARFIEKAKQSLAAKPPPAPANEFTEFEPQPLPPEVKSLVEDNPDLFEWHQSPEHADKWEAVTNADAFLRTTPEWKGKGRESVPARLVAAVQLVKAQHGIAAPAPPATPAPPAKPTAEDARKIIDKAAAAPLSVDDLRGRTPPTQISSKRAAWDQMSNDQILAGLPE